MVLDQNLELFSQIEKRKRKKEMRKFNSTKLMFHKSIQMAIQIKIDVFKVNNAQILQYRVRILEEYNTNPLRF